MNRWFTADLHLGHKNIIKPDYCDRPFATIEENDLELARRWDAVVKPEDEVYILGDLCFNVRQAEAFLENRPGQKIMIWGNHDPKKAGERARLAPRFVKTGDILETKDPVTDTKIVMCHYPMLRWNKAHFGSWMLHGHTHGGLIYPMQAKIMDVGVDADGSGYFPVSLDVVRAHMAARPLVEHHYFQGEE